MARALWSSWKFASSKLRSLLVHFLVNVCLRKPRRSSLVWNFGIVAAASLFKPTVAETQHSRGADCLKQLERKSARHGRSLQRRSQNPELRRRAARHGVAMMTGREKGPAGMRRAARRGLAAFAPGKRSERMAPAGVRSYRTRVAELSFFKQS